ncbi:hypothetical protein [Pedosphaera parvula]|nr:hypothetical protein [Pedosphaera parvula]
MQNGEPLTCPLDILSPLKYSRGEEVAGWLGCPGYLTRPRAITDLGGFYEAESAVDRELTGANGSSGRVLKQPDPICWSSGCQSALLLSRRSLWICSCVAP